MEMMQCEKHKHNSKHNANSDYGARNKRAPRNKNIYLSNALHTEMLCKMQQMQNKKHCIN